jgi:hypothetical protein
VESLEDAVDRIFGAVVYGRALFAATDPPINAPVVPLAIFRPHSLGRQAERVGRRRGTSMRRVSKPVLRVLVLAAVAIAAALIYAPLSGSNTPYVSALSDLTLGSPILAAPSCPFTGCSSTQPFFCVSGTRLAHECKLQNNGSCTTLICK